MKTVYVIEEWFSGKWREVEELPHIDHALERAEEYWTCRTRGVRVMEERRMLVDVVEKPMNNVHGPDEAVERHMKYRVFRTEIWRHAEEACGLPQRSGT